MSATGYVAYYQDRPVSITDESGSTVWSPPGEPPGLGVAHRPNLVPPGSSFTFITVQWDQRTCDSACASDMQGGKEGSLVRPGTYVAHGGYSAGNSGRLSAGQASFAVTAA